MLLLTTGAFAAQQSAEKPFVSPLFCDHMVFQRQVKAPVWGWAVPETKVTVEFGGQSQTAIAGADGKWMAYLKPMKASSVPQTLTISSGTKTITVNDVLVGDVWICSGQSNMQMDLVSCNANRDIEQANFPQIRLLYVPRVVSKVPQETVKASWEPCSSKNVAGFSAVSFYFGRDLHRELNIPIGLIHSSWGGTKGESWVSAEALKSMGDFDSQLAALPNPEPDFQTELESWYQRLDTGTVRGWARPNADTSSWKNVNLPQSLEQVGLANYTGTVWFQHTFQLPSDWAGKDLELQMGHLDDSETTYVNGQKVGQGLSWDAERTYKVPSIFLKPGNNVVTVRLLNGYGPGGFFGKPEQMFIKRLDGTGKPISLAGAWFMRESTPMNKLPGMPVPASENPHVVTALYNAMISPLVPYGIKGAIWYQGESNADRAEQYRRLLPLMIGDWRTRFGVGDFPFYIVQLANFQPISDKPRDNEWAELREAQALTARNLRNSGLAVAIDIGDAVDIHPRDKASVGRRLALCALAKTYGEDLVYSGPWFRSMKIKGESIRLKFDHVDGGLLAYGDNLKGFAIAGEDRKFVWANATIVGKEVVVSSPEVTKPVAVRYGWDINPVCNLYNRTGLPAVPFRTDDWPMLTKGRK